ncbi:2,3-bisphosphoglycerate-dependent phosphoglycerate mutase [Natronobacillus azotifigens]|uniref:Histidine phosphatase family protein n=1 Tax=Natronobacillus azotifigens TaxID=472978 RepID=A0A9J6RCJ4_9BACI|nr:histidine phosphatase family protein [Natronobacillus azotifigens]MCZ0703075.1 histidine phosphatase family protein [Natronobacillus azotifigens]
MTIVYFVRHAESNVNNHDDLSRELTEKGKKDRKLVTKFLLEKRIDLVFSSPYKRAVDTVKDFADQEGYAIQKIDDFRERKVDAGWIDDFSSFAKQQWEDFNYKRSEGESLHEVQERNIAALHAILEDHGNKNIVIGSHGTALSTVINYYDGSFGFQDFEKIKTLMPWIVQFTFEGKQCTGIKSIDILNGY